MKRLIFIIMVTTLNIGYSFTRGNDPFLFDQDIVARFSRLPTTGGLDKQFIAWPANHWPGHLGGVAQRWSATENSAFSYKTYSKDQLQNLESHLLDELSPAEKYDIYMGRYDFPTVAKEKKRTNPYNTDWFGICHGVAPASLHFDEPKKVSVTNADGILLTFYSSDIKALLSYNYAIVQYRNSKQLGKRCKATSWDHIRFWQRSACEDMDPAAFHLILTNYLGLQSKSFVVDIDPLNQVWNHVPTEYSYDVYEEYPALEHSTPGTHKVLWIGLKVSYAAAIAPYFEPVIGQDQAYYIDHHYQYELDLNHEGDVIGGRWIGQQRPDFLWIRDKIAFSGYWQSLYDIYLPVTK